MTPTRPPDIDILKDETPGDCVLISGTHLMNAARILKIPYGLARHRNQKHAWVTDGILIYKSDERKWNAYQKSKN